MEAIESQKSDCHCNVTSVQDGSRSAKSKRREFAPLASFEDLEEFKPKTSNLMKNCLPVINDDHELHAIDPEVIISTQQFVATVKSSQRPDTIHSVGPPKLPLDVNLDNTTPPTPRINISCASSSSTISDEIPSSEKELLRYGLGLDCKEEVEDLRSSTEEIAFEDSNFPDDSRRIAIENLRRGSHPANIFSRKLSTITLGDNLFRKPSVYSLHAEAFSPRMGRHASFGSSDAHRPKSCAPSPTPTTISGRRSVSPHLLMFETSFCGNRPMHVDPDAQVYAGPVSTTSSEVQVHSSSCDKAHITKAQVERHSSPPMTPPSTQEQCPSTSKSTAIRSFESNWCERFVIPNQPSMEDSDDGGTSDKVRLDTDDDQVKSHINCTKDESTDFSDKDAKIDENISDFENVVPNEEKAALGASNPSLAAVPQETAGLFLDEALDEESDLPYVPTILPLEKSAALPIVPVKDRASYFVPTTPIQRPRSTQPPNFTKIEDYITKVTSQEVKSGTEKMKISLPKEDSLGDEPTDKNRTPKKEMPTTWTNFAEMGLRNPRNLRRQVQEDFK